MKNKNEKVVSLADRVIAYADKKVKEHKDARDVLIKKLGKVGADGAIKSWSKWHLQDVVGLETMIEWWTTTGEIVRRRQAENRSDESIIGMLKGWRESLIMDILSHSTKSSTSAFANMIDNIEQDAKKKFVGSSTLDSDSLMYMFSSLGN
jgi:hypothetical protein